MQESRRASAGELRQEDAVAAQPESFRMPFCRRISGRRCRRISGRRYRRIQDVVTGEIQDVVTVQEGFGRRTPLPYSRRAVVTINGSL